MPRLTTLDDIKEARNALPEFIRHTPILPLARDSAEVGREKLFLKCENLQVTGAYKVRAAYTVLRSLSDEQRKRGLVVTSSGNFAQAYAYAGAGRLRGSDQQVDTLHRIFRTAKQPWCNWVF